jgi:hypothetical protein
MVPFEPTVIPELVALEPEPELVVAGVELVVAAEVVGVVFELDPHPATNTAAHTTASSAAFFIALPP